MKYLITLVLVGFNVFSYANLIEHQNCIISSIFLNNSTQFNFYEYSDYVKGTERFKTSPAPKIISALEKLNYKVPTREELKLEKSLFFNLETKMDTNYGYVQRQESPYFLDQVGEFLVSSIEGALTTIVAPIQDLVKEVKFDITAYGVKNQRITESSTTVLKRVNLAREAGLFSKISEMIKDIEKKEEKVKEIEEELEATLNNPEQTAEVNKLRMQQARLESEIQIEKQALKILKINYFKLNKNVYAHGTKRKSESIEFNTRIIAEGEENFFFKSTAMEEGFLLDFVERNVPQCIVNPDANHDQTIYL